MFVRKILLVKSYIDWDLPLFEKSGSKTCDLLLWLIDTIFAQKILFCTNGKFNLKLMVTKKVSKF